MRASISFVCVVSAMASCGLALWADEDGWNLPPAQRVAEAEAAAARGDTTTAQRVLLQLEAGAKACGNLVERTAVEARVDRVRLALGRALTRADRWEQALPLLTAIPLEGKSTAVQRAICAAMLNALQPLLFKPDGRIVTPWMPVCNDRYGPLQPDESLRAPYTRVDRKQAAEQIGSALTAWERFAESKEGELTDAESAVVKVLRKATIALVRYAWGQGTLTNAAQAVAAAPEVERRAQMLRLAQLLLDERDLAHAIPYLLELEGGAQKDEVHSAAVEELLRIECVYDRLKTGLPLWNPGVDEVVQPYLKDPAWAAARGRIVKELDQAIGAVDLSIVLGETELVFKKFTASNRDALHTDSASKETPEILVPPDILANAELGNHFETPAEPPAKAPNVPMLDARIKELTEKKTEPLTEKENEELAELRKLKKELEKLAGEKPSRYRKLGFLAGVLRRNVLLTLDPRQSGAREVREEFELQVDHQEFMFEALGPSWQKDTLKGFRPLTPDSPLRLVLLTRYHGDLSIEVRAVPDSATFWQLDGAVTPEAVAKLPIVKTYNVPLPPMWNNLSADPTKRVVEVAQHGLAPGFCVLLARARYAPVLAVTRVAVCDTKVVVRHTPRDVLLWTLDRLSGAPRPATKLAGEIRLEYVAETAWGDRPLPPRARSGTQAATAEEGTLRPAALEWDRAKFLEGFGEALNNQARQMADDSYLAGVAEGRKQRAAFPPQALKLPAESDAEGLARVALPSEWLGHRCRIRVAANGCEVDSVETLQPLRREKAERVVEWVADRPVARPGQTLRLRGFVREARNGQMSVAHGGETPLRLTVGGAVLFDGPVPVDESGASVFEQLIDPDTLDGVVSATCGKKTKELCAIRGGEPATRRLRLELPRQPVAAGARAKCRVAIESAAGVPLSGVPVNVKAHFTDYAWRQSALLPFGDDLPRAAKPGEQRLQGWDCEHELLSDSSGLVELEIETPEGRDAVGVVSVSAPGGRHAAAEEQGQVLSLAAACAWRVEAAEAPPLGKPARIALAGRMLSGEPYARPFEIADDEGRLLGRLTPAADGHGSAEVQAPPHGRVKVRPAEAGDGDWQTVQLTPAGAETAEVRGRLLSARLDKKEYRVGDTAHLVLRADRPNLTVLLTTEGSGITRTEVLKVAARTQDVEIRIVEQDAPNTTIALTTLADDLVDCVLVPVDVAQSERELAVKVAFDQAWTEPGQTVQLAVAVADSHGQPIADADVVLAVFDRQLLTLAEDPAPPFGGPFRAANRAPHEGVWMAGSQMFNYGCGFLWLTPEWSYGPYAVEANGLMVGAGIGVDSGSGHGSFGARHGGGRRLLIKRHGGSFACTSGGSSFRVRANFAEQALWLTRLKTGPDGRVTTPFLAPDNLSTFRAVAYVLDARGFPGAGAAELVVRRDVEAVLELPPELREGDQAEVALSINNHCDKKRRVRLNAKLPLPVLSSHWVDGGKMKPVPDEFEIAPYSVCTLRYLLRVEPQAATNPPGEEPDAAAAFEPGVLGQALPFEVGVTAPDGADLDRAVFQAPLRFAGRPEREVTQAVLRQGGTMRAPFAGSFDAEHISLTVTLRRGLKGLALDVRSLQYVFPEHCLEQTLSRFVPAAVLAEALSPAEQSPTDRARLQGVLRSGVVRLRTLSKATMDSELLPLAAWYFQRLSRTTAGRAALAGGSDGLTAAERSESALRRLVGEKFKLEEWPLPASSSCAPLAYGGFRRDLWLAFGAAQKARSAKTVSEKREFRGRFAKLCQSAVLLARTHKLLDHDRALAALLCATVGRQTEAEELLAARGAPAEAAPATATPQARRQQAWRAHQMNTLAAALELLTLAALGRSESEILPQALRLEGQACANGPAFGSTFLNGVSLLSLAEALKACGGAAKVEPGPITLRLSGKAVVELPAGADLRRVTLDPAAVRAAFNDGWEFTLDAPAGQTVGVAVERLTLVRETPRELAGQEADTRLASLLEIPSADTQAAPLQIRRALFVREPNRKDRVLHVGWRPYLGQPVPRGTEMLVVTAVLNQQEVEFTQVELPTLDGWEAMLWNEQYAIENPRGVEYESLRFGTVSGHLVNAAVNRDGGDGRSAAAELLRLVKEGRWAACPGRINWEKHFERSRFSDRRSRFVSIPNAAGGAQLHGQSQPPVGPWQLRVLAQSGELRAGGRYCLPGARVWAWYDPQLDVTGPADLVQVSDHPTQTLETPLTAPAWQPWLEKAWSLLARDGWETKAYQGGGETIDLAPLTLLALAHSPAAQGEALIREYLGAQPKPASLAQFRLQRTERLALLEAAGLTAGPAELRRALLLPLTSWEGLRQEWLAAGLPGREEPPPVEVLNEWLGEEKERAERLLVALPPADRRQSVALQKRTTRDVLEMWFAGRGDAGRAALDWLWGRQAVEFITNDGVTLDGWVESLREKHGLNATVDARAPLVLSLPPAERAETLRDYVANHLAAGEIEAFGIDDGQKVVLRQIGSEATDGKPLNGKAALELPVFSLGVSGDCVPRLQEALLERGVQFVCPKAEFNASKIPLRTVLSWLARVTERSVRIEGDIIELR